MLRQTGGGNQAEGEAHYKGRLWRADVVRPRLPGHPCMVLVSRITHLGILVLLLALQFKLLFLHVHNAPPLNVLLQGL